MKRTLTHAIIAACLFAHVAFSQDSTIRRTDTRDMQKVLRREVQRSEPDYIGYLPRSWDGSTNDSHNEHYLVFEGPDGSLMAIWTQSLVFNEAKNRIVFSTSTDGGHKWTEPTHVVGPRTPDDPTYVASWAFPMVSRSGRIYVLYNQNQDNQGWIKMHTGTMDGVYSDDLGRTWSKPQRVPMPRSPYDDPEGKIPGEWIVWQIQDHIASSTRRLVLLGEPHGADYFADTGPFTAGGIASVLFGAGDIAQAHTADEYLELDQLYRATEVILTLLAENAGRSILWETRR